MDQKQMFMKSLTIGYRLILCNVCFAALLFMISFAACKKSVPNPEAEYRSVAWNFLDLQEKNTVTSNWKKAPVTYQAYKGQEAAAVRFNTTQDVLLGPIVVFVAVDRKTVLGVALRD